MSVHSDLNLCLFETFWKNEHWQSVGEIFFKLRKMEDYQGRPEALEFLLRVAMSQLLHSYFFVKSESSLRPVISNSISSSDSQPFPTWTPPTHVYQKSTPHVYAPHLHSPSSFHPL
jgi:hypothetical protein